MKWDIQFTRLASKQAKHLPKRTYLILQVLTENLKVKGPAPGHQWHNYGKLWGKKQQDRRHCHLSKGNPTYVCCWEVFKSERRIEVFYVGTHEKAPY